MAEAGEEQNGAEWQSVFLMNDDRSRCIQVWFFGFTADRIREFMSEKYASSKRWTQYKFAE